MNPMGKLKEKENKVCLPKICVGFQCKNTFGYSKQNPHSYYRFRLLNELLQYDNPSKITQIPSENFDEHLSGFEYTPDKWNHEIRIPNSTTPSCDAVIFHYFHFALKV